MARKPDMTNIRKRRVGRNGKPETRYQVRVRLQDDRGVLRRHTNTFETYEDATLWRDRMRSQVRLGEAGEKLERLRTLQSVTLGDLIRRYRGDVRFRLKRSSTNELIILDGFARAEANGLCKKSLADLRTEDFAAYRDRRLSGPNRVKPATLRRELNPIRHMLKVARQDWGHPIEPLFYGFYLPKEDAQRDRVLTPNERFRLYRAIEGCRGKQQQLLWLSLIQVALNTALRRGELLKLEWRDLDLWDPDGRKRGGTLSVRAEITKTNKARLLPLTQRAWSQLCMYREAIPEELRTPMAKVFGVNERTTLAYLGLKKKVSGITASAFEQGFKRICKRAGIANLHFHDLRHTAATSFGSRPIELSLWIGAFFRFEVRSILAC
jgi:integrase